MEVDPKLSSIEVKICYAWAIQEALPALYRKQDSTSHALADMIATAILDQVEVKEKK
jgi:hypothetical protein